MPAHLAREERFGVVVPLRLGLLALLLLQHVDRLALLLYRREDVLRVEEFRIDGGVLEAAAHLGGKHCKPRMAIMCVASGVKHACGAGC